MKFHTSTKKIPQLADKPLTERIALLDDAAKRMTVPEKTILNVLKLLVIVPVFMFVLQVSNNWLSLLWAGLTLLLYPLVVKPIQYSLSAKHLKNDS